MFILIWEKMFFVFVLKEIRRQLQLEAAEKRRMESESRGIKDVDKVRRQQQKAEELAKREEEAAKYGSGGNPNLRWQSD